MANDGERVRRFKPGEKIKYSRKPLIRPYRKGEWMLENSEDTILSYLIGKNSPNSDIEDALPPALDKSRASPNCIISGQLPTPNGKGGSNAGFKKSRKAETVNSVLLTGLAYSQFYNGLYQVGMERMRCVNSQIPNNKVAVTPTLLQLESAVYLRIERDVIVKELQRFERSFRTTPDISHLLTLAFEMKNNRRHYGAILACRVASSAHSSVAGRNYSGIFRRMYVILFEMSLRALNVLGRNWDGNKLVIRCMCDVVDEMTALVELLENSSQARTLQLKMIAECRNAIAFCCNSVGMYETADKFGASVGLRTIEGFGVGVLRRYKIYPDLLVNKGISLLGQGLSDDAKYFFKTAIFNYKMCIDFTSPTEGQERCDRARTNAAAVECL